MAVGAARPSMTEMDSELMNSARVFVDSKSGAKTESGDIIKSNCKIEAELGEVIGKILNLNIISKCYLEALICMLRCLSSHFKCVKRTIFL
jgi:hypothetical protein